MDSSAFHSELMSQMSLSGTSPAADKKPDVACQEISELSRMVDDIDKTAEADAEPQTVANKTSSETSDASHKNELGVASNLFRGIQQKHSPTAAHGLRVALGCSVWSSARNDDEEFSKNLEVAALLHDIGKIGVPDDILAKPGELTDEEQQLMAKHRLNGLEILSNCGYPASILEAVAYSSAWYDGSRRGFKVKETEIPFAARMLSIVDAFDSMTTEQVYRRPMSVERAMAELFQCAGSQFDPDLIASFCTTVAPNWASLRQSAGQRWVAQVESPDSTGKFWQGRPGEVSNVQSRTPNSGESSGANDAGGSDLFHKALVDNMKDGVMYIGPRQRILVWNRSMERKTGISESSVREKRWVPSLTGMCYEGGREAISDDDCPIANTFQTGQQIAQRVSVMGRGEKRFTADLIVIPVLNASGSVVGVTVMLHDVSSKLSLEERVESLYSRVTMDPLTKVANRAEFDRVHAEFISNHMRDGLPCSLIICDLDFFKKINDDFGHQAGDHALVSFAALMKSSQHIGDLVARYGGEEFVMLCANCDNSSATGRAEQIRQILQSTPQPALDNKCLTSSFGVTEIQPGDTPETMLRRADRALLMAKEKGRNKVVQLGSGINDEGDAASSPGKNDFFSWFKTPASARVSERTLITSVPIDLAINKLKGFVSDQFAQIVSVDGDIIQLRADGHISDLMRRKSDRPVPFMISMNFSKLEEEQPQEGRRRSLSKTKVELIIEPIRSRDRRRADLTERAEQIIRSVKAYLMATDEKDNERPMLDRAATESGRDE